MFKTINLKMHLITLLRILTVLTLINYMKCLQLAKTSNPKLATLNTSRTFRVSVNLSMA